MNDWFEAEERVERAHELYESGRWEDALRELRAAINVNPYQGEWHFNMGLTLDAMGRYDEAIGSFERALEHHGEDLEILNNLGYDCLRTGRLREAVAYFERAQQLDPNEEACYSHRIAAYSQLGEHEQAELMFYLACHADAASPRAYFNMALSLLDRNLVEKAIWCLKKVRQLDPDDPEVHARLGEAYWARGRLDKAHGYYLRQLRLDPADTAAMMDLGNLLLEMDRPVEAAEKFRRVTEFDPAHADAHFQLGELALDAHDYDAAQMAFELVLRLGSSYPRAHQLLAVIALRRRRTEEARRHLRAELALEHPAQTAEEVEDLGRLLLDAHMPREAAGVLAAGVEEHPADPRMRHQLGLAQFMQGKLGAGIRNCRRAVRSDRRYTLAMHNLALAHLQLGQVRRAAYWARRALTIEPEDARMRQLQTRIHLAAIKRRLARLIGR